jgi:hypothetical protein
VEGLSVVTNIEQMNEDVVGIPYCECVFVKSRIVKYLAVFMMKHM